MIDENREKTLVVISLGAGVQSSTMAYGSQSVSICARSSRANK